MKFNILELYAGTGRSVEPFISWSRTRKIYLVDNDQYAADVYLHNHPKSNYGVYDLGKVRSSKLLSFSGGRVDVLLGCPPCQGFSDCGLKNVRDPRNRQMTRFEEIVCDLKPRVLAFENVPLVITSGRFKRFLRSLDELDYVWTAAVVNAALYGSCQSRQRLILVASQAKLRVRPQFPDPTHGGSRLYFNYSTQKFCQLKKNVLGMLGKTPATQRLEKQFSEERDDVFGPRTVPTVGEILDALPAIGTRNAKEINHIAWQHGGTIRKRMANVREGKRWSGGSDHFSQAYGRLHRRGLSRTITAFFPNAGSGRFWHPIDNRAITLREAARIQGFPDSFHFLASDRKNQHLVGNALDAALARVTFSVIENCLG
jgi:DNA (cytosine-5)-methyltransferase 1